MKKMNVSKILSTTLSLALAVTSAPMPASAVGPMAPAFVAKLTPPEQFGYVASSYAPKGEDRPRLIVIANLHSHVEVQNNIVGLLDHFVKRLVSRDSGMQETRVPIFVEGAWTEHLEEPLRTVKDAKIRSMLGDYLVEKGEMSAPQAYSEKNVGSKNVTLTGVENQEEYLAHKAQFASTYPMRKTLLQAIVRHEATVQKLQDVVQNKTFLKLQTQRDDYLKGKISPNLYARSLYRQAYKMGLHGAFVDTLKNVKQASSGDLDMALLGVHNAVAKRLSEDKPLSAYVRTELKNEDAVRLNLAFVDANLDLLKRVISNQLTPDEVPVAYAKLGDLVKVANLLLGDEKLGLDMKVSLEKCLDFYPFAFMRDESLVSNSLAALTKDATHPTTGILVVGGFHTGAIGQYLESHGIAHIMINPIVSRDITALEQFNYIKRMCDEHVTPQELVEDLRHPAGKTLIASSSLGAPISGNEQSGDVHLNGGQIDEMAHLIGTIHSTTNEAELGKVIDGVKKVVVYKQGSIGPMAYSETPESVESMQGRYDNLSALVGKGGYQIGKLDMAKGTSFTVKNGQIAASDVSSAQSDFAAAAYALLAEAYKGQPENAVKLDALDLQAVKADVITHYKTVGQEGKDWIRLSDKAIMVGMNSGRPVILMLEQWYDQLDLADLGATFKAAVATGVKGQFTKTQKEAARAAYALFHEASHLFLGRDEKLVEAHSMAQVIAAAYSLGTNNALSGPVQIPMWFVNNFVQAIAETENALPDEFVASIAKETASNPEATVSVDGLTTLINRGLSPAVFNETDVKELAAKFEKTVPGTNAEEANALAEAALSSFAVRMNGGRIPPGKLQSLIAYLRAKGFTRAADALVNGAA